MASLLQVSRKSFLSSYKTLNPLRHQFSLQPNKSNFLSIRQFCQNKVSENLQISPVESNILRILNNKIDDQLEFSPPIQPVDKFNNFTIEDNPGEKWITLRGKSTKGEFINIIATMIDGSFYVPSSGEDSNGHDIKFHMSLLVDISKQEEEGDLFEFTCSAWPDSLEIQKVYIYKPSDPIRHLYTGPNLKDKGKELGSALYEFLKARLVNDELAVFLHEYMTNKDKAEYIHWLKKVQLFMKS